MGKLELPQLSGNFVTRRTFLTAAAILLVGAVCPDPAVAQSREAKRRRQLQIMRRRLRRLRRREQADRAREALKKGANKPLFELIRKFERDVGGEVLDARYRERGLIRVYIFDVLFSDGRLVKFIVDAETEEIFTLQQAREHYGIEAGNGQDQ
ncbi:MAG: PepSY domain-containing protein [Rhizobiaceae bacterium]